MERNGYSTIVDGIATIKETDSETFIKLTHYIRRIKLMGEYPNFIRALRTQNHWFDAGYCSGVPFRIKDGLNGKRLLANLIWNAVNGAKRVYPTYHESWTDVEQLITLNDTFSPI